MGQNKLERFEAIKAFKNVLEYPQDMKGKWSEFFNNNHPITLELACGKGEYAVGLARLNAAQNLIGIDIKGNRIWKGAGIALKDGLTNVAFIRSLIDQVDDYFGVDEVAAIWITFPDPQLRFSKIKKRLTHPKFLRKYQSFLQKGGVVHLKTDSPDLYHFTKEVIELYQLELLVDYDDLYAIPHLPQELLIKTHYEGLNISGSNRIHYLQFKIDANLPMELDNVLHEKLRANYAFD